MEARVGIEPAPDIENTQVIDFIRVKKDAKDMIDER
jgi:hypothetical protein